MQRGINSQFDENLFSDSTVSTSRGALLAVMNVEIKPGHKDKIFIHQLDNEHQLAQQFVLKHGLPTKALPILQAQIQANKQAVRQSTLARPADSTPVSTRQKNEEIEQETLKKEGSQISMSRYSKQSYTKSSSMSRSRSTTDVTNRLYNENLMKTKYLFELEQRALKKLQKIQSEDTTHTPEINGISHALASERRKSARIENHLFQLGNQQTHRKQRAASMKVKQELNECSFKPTLNRMTAKLTNNRAQPTFSRALERNTENAYDNLFQPALNKMSKDIMVNKAPFMERQKQYQQAKQLKINSMYKQKRRNETTDPNTGMPLFQPSGSGYKPKLWNQNNLQVGEYLYQKGRVKNVPAPQQHRIKINQHSEQLVQNRQAKRIVWIFSQLDSDQDGWISSQKINIETIPDQILQVIMPILFEMEEFSFELNLEEFKQAIETLHLSLHSVQKSILYDYQKKKISA